MNPDNEFKLESAHLADVLEKAKSTRRSIEKSIDALGSGTLEKLKELRQNPESGADLFFFLEQLQEKFQAFNIKDKTQRFEELEHTEKEPYFARIDLKESGDNEAFYIGKFGFTHENKPVVTDWRAKIASVYYRYRFPQKNVEYDTPGGNVVADLTLKRTYEIQNATLIKYFNNDVGLDENEILVEKLRKRTGGVLEDIVETIQKSQMDIIEADPRQICIVQGCVGSGKSTVAIHKLSHIFFNHSRLIRPERSILIAKNQILVGYLSTLFPKLGIFGLNYGTLKDILVRIIFSEGLGLAIDFDNPSPDIGKKISFIKELDQRINTVSLSCEDRIRLLFGSAENQSFGGYVFDPSISVNQNVKEIIGEMEEELNNQNNFFRDPNVNNMRKETHKINVITIKKIISRLRSIQNTLRNTEFTNLIKSLDINRFQKLSYVETMVYIYAYIKIIGLVKFPLYDYCVIDEGQDFSVMEYAILGKLVAHGRMCILGDLNQGYDDTSITVWDDIQEVIESAKKAVKFELTTNYRSTKQIIDFAVGILTPYEKKYLPLSINRVGPVPIRQEFNEINDMLSVVIDEIAKEAENLTKSIGIICFESNLFDKMDDLLMSSKIPADKIIRLDKKKRISYIPAGVYLSDFEDCKGLEFAKVFVLGLDLDKVSGFEQAKKSFVAITRAMDELHVYRVCEKSN